MRQTKHSKIERLWHNIKLFMVALTLVTGISLAWNLFYQQDRFETTLNAQAAAFHSLEMEYRNWVIHNGGVYVPVTDKTPPSPWLSQVPDRDITTPSGKQLTLLNSSYVVRLVHEAMTGANKPFHGHIASLRPINPVNAADAWERKALETFARGAQERASIEVMDDGRTYFRYMKPMVTEEACLKCHAQHGDKLGEIRGGVSVSIPIEDLLLGERNTRNALIAGHGLIWGMGVFGLFFGGRRQQRAILAAEKAEEQLRAASLYMRSLIEASLDPLVTISADGYILDVNKATVNATGVSRDGLIGSDFSNYFTDPEKARAGYREVFAKGSVTDYPLAIRHVSGKIMDVLYNASVYHNEKGEVAGVFAAARDITERKQAEAELLRYKDYLEEEVQQRTADLVQARDAAEAANKAKSIFLANMSHELRTPLNAILGFSNMMRKNTSLEHRERDNLDLINRSGEHLLSVINDVLEMAKIDTGHIQLEEIQFDLGDVVRDVAEMLSVRAKEKGLQLVVDQSAQFPHFIIADEGRLRQILINLIGNAIKFTLQGSVTLRLRTKQNAIAHLLIEVQDTGSGIPLEDQQRIFEPFVQLGEHALNQGTGLGLTITRQFVQMMGGSLMLECTQGKGSLFRVELPFKEAREADIVLKSTEQARGEVISLAPGQPDYRILVVEDQSENQQLLTRLMESVGFQVKLAENGEQIVQLFQSWQPHLIWMDRRMTVMDGLEATKAIRSLPGGKQVKIVAVTASAFVEERDEMLNAGVDDFVRKPYRFNEIYECLTRQLDVQFIYADAQPEKETAAVPLTTQMLSALPPSLCHELQDALESLDADRIAAFIEQVAPYDVNLQKTLTQLANNFDYLPILKALQTIHR